MTTIFIHAGMAKTGSTSIQEWLKLRVDRLRDQHGITVLEEVAATEAEPYGFTPLATGFHVYTNIFLVRYASCIEGGEEALVPLAEEFAAALDQAASQFGTVLVTSEGFAALFQRGEKPFLHALEQLGRRHEVRVAYYVRPQNTAFEARWREWGFRTGRAPSEWVANECRELCYWETFELTRALAPSLTFDVRPFRRDLLVRGDVVDDFATGFLGLVDPPDTSDRSENPGIPLDLVNLLRGAPLELLDPLAGRRGWRQGALGPIAQRWNVEESAQVREARELLRRFAFSTFENDNQQLLESLGWPTDSFIAGPPPEMPCSGDELAALDELWAPPATDTVRAYLFAAMKEMWNLVDEVDGVGSSDGT